MTLSTRTAPEAIDTRPTDTTARAWRLALWGLFAVTAIAGLIGLWMRLTQGHLPAGYGSYVPWGLWIAVYFHGVGIAAGAFGVTAVAHLLQFPGFRDVRAVRLTSVLVAASVGPALIAVGLDLGQIGRAWRIIAAPSFTSMMAFNSWIYIALLVVCAAVWWLSYRPDRGWLRPVLTLGILIAIAVPSQSGAFFGVVDSKPYWHSALLPILLLISALTAGSAALLVVRHVIARLAGTSPPQGIREPISAVAFLRWVVLAGLISYFFLEFAEFSVVLWNPQASAPEISLVLTGPYWWVFWLVHVLLGGLIPLVLLSMRRPVLWVLAAGLVSVTFISTRLNVLIPGQSISEIEGLQDAFFHPRLSFVYVATPMEYLVALGCFALGMAVLYIGWRLSGVIEKRLTPTPPTLTSKDPQ